MRAMKASPSLRRDSTARGPACIRWDRRIESQVLQLAANFAHAEAVRDGGIDFQRLLGDFLLALGRDVRGCACCAGGRRA